MLVFGGWMKLQIENNTIKRAAAMSAIYVESILAAQLHHWQDVHVFDEELKVLLDQIFLHGPLRRKVVSFKLWKPGGDLVYATAAEQAGRRYPVSEHLAAAFAGDVQSEISALEASDESPERMRSRRLLEVYVPLHAPADNRVIAVAEFYHSMDNIERDIDAAQKQGWALVVFGALAIFLFLFGLMQRANRTITLQHRYMREKLRRLNATLTENELIRNELSAAGAQATALNEQFLRRIAADLHDGPAQELAFALLRFDEMLLHHAFSAPIEGAAREHSQTIHQALQSSLSELRSISADLGVPGGAHLPLTDTLQRAIRDAKRNEEMDIVADIASDLGDPPVAVKITAYRFLQESLTNCWRHARGAAIGVTASCEDGTLVIRVSDTGPGFAAAAHAERADRLGLAFMDVRIRLLGGDLRIDTAPGRGTTLTARIPGACRSTP